MTTITQIQNIECQMVEFDEKVRYMRIRTPSIPQRVWFLPTTGGDEPFRFVLLDQDKCKELEEQYQQHTGAKA